MADRCPIGGPELHVGLGKAPVYLLDRTHLGEQLGLEPPNGGIRIEPAEHDRTGIGRIPVPGIQAGESAFSGVGSTPPIGIPWAPKAITRTSSLLSSAIRYASWSVIGQASAPSGSVCVRGFATFGSCIGNVEEATPAGRQAQTLHLSGMSPAWWSGSRGLRQLRDDGRLGCIGDQVHATLDAEIHQLRHHPGFPDASSSPCRHRAAQRAIAVAALRHDSLPTIPGPLISISIVIGELRGLGLAGLRWSQCQSGPRGQNVPRQSHGSPSSMPKK